MKSDSDREFDIGPLVDRELNSPGWVRKKQKAGGRGATIAGNGAGSGSGGGGASNGQPN